MAGLMSLPYFYNIAKDLGSISLPSLDIPENNETRQQRSKRRALERQLAKKQTGEQYWAAVNGQRLPDDPMNQVGMMAQFNELMNPTAPQHSPFVNPLQQSVSDMAQVIPQPLGDGRGNPAVNMTDMNHPTPAPVAQPPVAPTRAPARMAAASVPVGPTPEQIATQQAVQQAAQQQAMQQAYYMSQLNPLGGNSEYADLQRGHFNR